MKYLNFVLLLIFLTNHVCCQKPIIDSSAIANWRTIGHRTVISANGQYIFYSIYGYNYCETLVVQSLNTGWKKEFSGVSGSDLQTETNPFFTRDSKQLIYLSKDTLIFFSLQFKQRRYVIDQISSFKHLFGKTGDWLFYQKKKSGGVLSVKNLSNNTEQHFVGVEDYLVDQRGTTLILKLNKKSNVELSALTRVDLESGKKYSIWDAFDPSFKVTSLALDHMGDQLAFMINRPIRGINSYVNELWYYNRSMPYAVLKANDNTIGIDKGLILSQKSPVFSNNGKYIFLGLKPIHEIDQMLVANSVNVDIWSYTDSVILSAQEKIRPNVEFAAVLNIYSNNIIRLENENQFCLLDDSHIGDQFVVVSDKRVDEYWWKTNKTKGVYLVSLIDGLRRRITDEICEYWFLPTTNFLLYFDGEKRDYFSYDLTSGDLHCLSEGISDTLWLNSKAGYDSLPGFTANAIGLAGWVPNEQAVIVYGQYDLWRLDLSGKIPAYSVTNGYGQLNRILFRITGPENDLKSYSSSDKVLLTAFNEMNKENGFFEGTLSKAKDPKLMCMGPYVMYIVSSQIAMLDGGAMPIKSEKTNSWIVQKQSINDAPNFYVTKNFKTYRRLTNLQPQKQYNWLTSELVTWKNLDGGLSSGVLYRPENFDLKKKYPIIFNYYEQVSQFLNQFPQLNFASGDICIAWFVSRGYLVFCPDIRYNVGFPGRSALNAAVSAADYLSKMPFIDTSKMALSGHSFGGYETNFIVANTNLFAAACSAAGLSDFVSGYSSISGFGKNVSQSRYENEQNRVGATLWEKPNLYIENSPMFSAGRITTPILIMHNKADGNVPWMQSFEFFTGLRRLQKPAWMLQYDEGNHTLTNVNDKIDFSKRMLQFFDHYLKGVPPPRWMTLGRPAYLKKIADRLELDPDGMCSDNCKVCREKKYFDYKPIPF